MIELVLAGFAVGFVLLAFVAVIAVILLAMRQQAMRGVETQHQFLEFLAGLKAQWVTDHERLLDILTHDRQTMTGHHERLLGAFQSERDQHIDHQSTLMRAVIARYAVEFTSMENAAVINEARAAAAENLRAEKLAPMTEEDRQARMDRQVMRRGDITPAQQEQLDELRFDQSLERLLENADA